MTFELHPNFIHKPLITDLALCRVLLEPVHPYPWVILVPRRAGLSRLMDLSVQDQAPFWEELSLVQHVLWEHFQPTQLNVAAIGNKTPQLHVHVIARFAHDPAWPGTVWDHPVKDRSSSEEESYRVRIIREALHQSPRALHSP